MSFTVRLCLGTCTSFLTFIFSCCHFLNILLVSSLENTPRKRLFGATAPQYRIPPLLVRSAASAPVLQVALGYRDPPQYSRWHWGTGILPSTPGGTGVPGQMQVPGGSRVCEALRHLWPGPKYLTPTWICLLLFL